MKVYSSLEKANLEQLASNPTSTTLGYIYFNTTTNKFRIWNGTDWKEIESDIATVSANLATEITNRTNADNAEATARANADSAEATARANGDSNEATARANADAAHAATTSSTHGVTGNIVGTSDAQTLTNKTLTGAVVSNFEDFTEQGSSPAAPVSGKRRMYVKTNGKAYLQDSTGLEKALGSGSGSGAKNYLSEGLIVGSNTNNISGDFEDGSTTGWHLGHISLDSNKNPTGSPTVGSGFDPGLTFTTISGSPLSGVYSGAYVNANPAVAGDCLISDAFYIDPSDQAKVLSLSCNYKAYSGAANMSFAGNNTGTFAVGLWDVTNSQWLGVTGAFGFDQATGVGKWTGTAQTNYNTSQLRFVLYTANSTSGACTLEVDDFVCTPQVITQGTPVTDPVNYTPTIGGAGTTSSMDLKWERIGPNIHIYGAFQTGTPTATTATLPLPSGLTAGVTSGLVRGQWWRDDAGAGNVKRGTFVVTVGSSALDFSVDTYSLADSPATTYTGSLLWAAAQFVYVDVTLPVTGWSAQTQMSSDASTAPMEAKVYLSGNVTSSGSAWTIPFDSVVYDTAGVFNTGTGGYKVPKPGYWEVSLTSNLAGGNTGSFEVYKNGSPISDGPTHAILFYQGTANNVMSGSIKVKCSAGDILTVVATGTGANIIATGTFATFSQSLGPSQIAASEKIRAKYTVSVTSIVSSPSQPFNYDQKIYDTHGAVTASAPGTGNWKFTAPRADWYKVFATNYSGGNTCIDIYKNGTPVEHIGYINASLGPDTGATEIYLLAGEYIDIRFDSSQSTGGTSYYHNHIEIAAG